MSKQDEQKAIIINASLSQEFLDWMDEWANKTKSNRSEFIRSAVRHYIQYLKSKESKNLPLTND